MVCQLVGKMKFTISILALGIILYGACRIQAMKCRTDDGGPSNDEIKKIVRSCMKKLDKNIGSDRNYDEYENASSEESNDNREYGRNSYIGANPRYRRSPWTPNRYENGYDQKNGGRQGSGHGNVRVDLRNQTAKEDISDHDRSCIIQCFLQEMKMTNTDGFPDKHKASQILTKDIRDHQLRDFFSDTIQECFHVLDLDKKRDKCDYSRNLVNCFAERGKMNCDDWQDDANGLFY